MSQRRANPPVIVVGTDQFALKMVLQNAVLFPAMHKSTIRVVIDCEFLDGFGSGGLEGWHRYGIT